jgi:hypothetical protein
MLHLAALAGVGLDHLDDLPRVPLFEAARIVGVDVECRIIDVIDVAFSALRVLYSSSVVWVYTGFGVEG